LQSSFFFAASTRDFAAGRAMAHVEQTVGSTPRERGFTNRLN
jgi:hypothetical protein